MVFLLDASAVSAMIREPRILDVRARALAAEDRIVVCTIVRGEVLFGIARLPHGRRREELRAKVAAVFARLPCEPIPSGAGDHYATVKLERQRAGLSLDENDLWIAATCLAMDATLVTRDSDFQGIDGLKIQDWVQ